MYTNEKIYSIDLGEGLESLDRFEEPNVAPRTGKSSPRRTKPVAKPSPKPLPKPSSKQPRGEMQFAPLMVLTYLLGPFSVHLNPANRGRKELLAVGMVSGMACLGMLAGRSFIQDIIGKGLPLLPWVVAGATVLLTAFSVWARAAFLVVSHFNQPRHQLPALFRKPWVVGVVGLFAPGLGLLLAGCPRRGAAVLWLGGPVVAAALLLINGLRIWNLPQWAEGASISPGVLETTLLVSCWILATWLVVWIAQALEGARQLMGEPGIRHRMRGDWYAAALLFTMMGLGIIWNPVTTARYLNDGGVILQEKGFRVIPLQLAKWAYRLDPGPTEYSVRVMALYGELGRGGEAMRLRQELDKNLASYLALIQTENRQLYADPHPGRSSSRDWQVVGDLLGQPDPEWGHQTNYQAR